jgi:hypothetical protein
VHFETGVVKADRDSGEHLWRTQLAAVDPTGGEIVTALPVADDAQPPAGRTRPTGSHQGRRR